jgi:hypothetical protein
MTWLFNGSFDTSGSASHGPSGGLAADIASGEGDRLNADLERHVQSGTIRSRVRLSLPFDLTIMRQKSSTR